MAAKKRSSSKVTGSAQPTIDPEEIRQWVEDRGGHPARVKRTRGGRGPGIVRIDFPGFSGEDSLEAISWDEFFQIFEKSGLAFLHQDATKGGRPSRFNKLVGRESVGLGEAPPSSNGRSRRTLQAPKVEGTQRAARSARRRPAKKSTRGASSGGRSSSASGRSSSAGGRARKTSSKRGTRKSSSR